jgi:hypothetical protein
MFAKLGDFLRQPFPFEKSITRILFSSFIVGLFVSIFLLVFRPFGSGEYILEGRTWILWGYGFVTFLILLADMLVLPAVFPRIFDKTKWNIFKAICFQFWYIVSIGAANLFYAKFIGEKNINILDVPGFLLTALAIGIFPITLGVLSIHIFLLRKYLASAKEINERIVSLGSRRGATDEGRQAVVITSETGKEKAEINLKDLLFIKSVDNYVEVYKTDGGNVKMIFLRSSIKRIEANLKEPPLLFKCHRAFLVNVSNISRVMGNSQGYKLIFAGVDHSIPVSRNYSKKLKELIAGT